MPFYLLQEDGVSKILLEDGSGAIILEAAPVSVAVTGTIITNTTEAEIVAGGRTIVLTVLNDTWVTAGAAFDAQRQNILNGLTSAQGEAFGWNALVKGAEVVTAVTRTSDTVVTITLSPVPLYNIAFDEVVTVTVPATALTGGAAIVGSPTFGISYVPTKWGGDDAPQRKRTRRQRRQEDVLFEQIESTLKTVMAGPVLEFEDEGTVPAVPQTVEVDDTFARLAKLAQAQDDKLARIEALRIQWQQYERQLAQELEEDDYEVLLLA